MLLAFEEVADYAGADACDLLVLRLLEIFEYVQALCSLKHLSQEWQPITCHFLEDLRQALTEIFHAVPVCLERYDTFAQAFKQLFHLFWRWQNQYVQLGVA